jgi:DNA-binding MarR family transcriptional regulator
VLKNCYRSSGRRDANQPGSPRFATLFRGTASGGDAFTQLGLEVAALGGLLIAAGETLARLADQSLARWVVLDALEDRPATVAQVARRRRGIARQAVQRIADLLVRDGLAVYLPNPANRRAQLAGPNPAQWSARARSSRNSEKIVLA